MGLHSLTFPNSPLSVCIHMTVSASVADKETSLGKLKAGPAGSRPMRMIKITIKNAESGARYASYLVDGSRANLAKFETH